MSSDTPSEPSSEPSEDDSTDAPPESVVDEQVTSGPEAAESTTVVTEDPGESTSESDESDEVEPDEDAEPAEEQAEEEADEDVEPEITDPSERFQAAIQGGTLKTVVKTLGAIVDETRIHVDENGIRMRAVDPANVAMDDLELDAGAFESYDATPGMIGVDLEHFEDVIKMANAGDLVQLALDQESRKLVVHIDGIEFTMACLDPQTIRAEPELPDLDLAAEVTIECDALDRGVKAADMVSDHVYVRMDAASEQFFIEADGDVDEVSLEIGDDELEDVTAADAESLFSLDYMKDLVRTIPTGVAVTVTFGTDFPLLMAYEIADGAGHVTRMLAPRIRSE